VPPPAGRAAAAKAPDGKKVPPPAGRAAAANAPDGKKPRPDDYSEEESFLDEDEMEKIMQEYEK
jgi:hypothetical protein